MSSSHAVVGALALVSLTVNSWRQIESRGAEEMGRSKGQVMGRTFNSQVTQSTITRSSHQLISVS